MATSKRPFHLCLRDWVHFGTCIILSKGWIPFHQTQWVQGLDCPPDVRCLPWCLHQTQPPTNYRGNLFRCLYYFSNGARLDIAANGFWGWPFRENLLWCESIQPSSSFKQTLHTICLLPETWNDQEEGLWATNQRSWAQYLHTNCAITHWWLILGNAATRCYKRLASLLSTKLDQPCICIWEDYDLDKMTTLLLPALLFNTMYKGTTLFQWLCLHTE